VLAGEDPFDETTMLDPDEEVSPEVLAELEAKKTEPAPVGVGL
jgi:hypothetical protein